MSKQLRETVRRRNIKGYKILDGSLVRVEVKASDGSLDYYVPRDKARELYRDGKLSIDMTNSRDEYVYLEIPEYSAEVRRHKYV